DADADGEAVGCAARRVTSNPCLPTSSRSSNPTAKPKSARRLSRSPPNTWRRPAAATGACPHCTRRPDSPRASTRRCRAPGGTLTTGGTEASFTALLAARAAVLPEAWTAGVGSDPPVLLCGEHAHYAVTRAAGELGIGMKNVLPIRSRDYKLDPDALRQALE